VLLAILPANLAAQEQLVDPRAAFRRPAGDNNELVVMLRRRGHEGELAAAVMKANSPPRLLMPRSETARPTTRV
jgi:hypothetical protein